METEQKSNQKYQTQKIIFYPIGRFQSICLIQKTAINYKY